MNLQELVRSRRHIKEFTTEPVDRNQILDLFETATYAPNHRMLEPWEIRFVGPQTRKRLNHKADFGGAPMVFAVWAKAAGTQTDTEENVIATSCFMQNFLLLAHEVGLGVRWASLGALPQNREILGVPDGDVVVGVFGIGQPSIVPNAKPRTPISVKTADLP